nr:hypothetical protein CFP56_70131 [Quercus suber]
MSYTPTTYYSSTPPAPPPKPPTSGTPSQGPPLPPPPPGTHPNPPQELDSGPNPSYRSSSSSFSAQQHQQQPQPPLHPAIPTIEPGWLPATLHDKPTAALQTLLADRSLQAALLANPSTTHPSVPASTALLQAHLTTNLHLASAVAARETQLAQLRAQTQTRLLALRALEQQHRAKLSETETALAAFAPRALYARLNAGVLEQEQVLRGLQQSWLEGEEGERVASEREVVEFLRRVKDAGKTAFLRRERKERWDEGRVERLFRSEKGEGKILSPRKKIQAMAADYRHRPRGDRGEARQCMTLKMYLGAEEGGYGTDTPG